MRSDDILRLLNKITLEKIRLLEQQKGPPHYGFSGFRDGQGRMEFPDDGKTITLTKDDYTEEEQCQTDPPQSGQKSIEDGTGE